ncbi:MAG TPA: hypothetical protein VLZ11_07650 [Flavobacterium sp.]|nr:hypothetical protein [Flavobacterium sp.]
MSAKIKMLQTIHLALCLGVILFYLLIGGISVESLNIAKVDGSSLVYLALPVLAFVLSDFLFKNQLKKADHKLKAEDNYMVYQNASIIRWAVLEGAAMLIAILKPDFILFGILLIVYLAFVRPTEARMRKDLATL